MRLAAKYDRIAKTVSPLVALILIIIGAFTQPLLIAIIGGVTLAIAFGYSTLGYEISESNVVVHRLFGNVSIPVPEITIARAATAEDLRGTMRIWGSGGVFGYYGLFRTSKLGNCTWYVTDRGKCVILRTQLKTFVISPDEVEGFLSALSPLISGAAEEPAPDFARKSGRRRILLGLSAGLVLLAVWFAMSYSPGIPGYSLTPDSLAIQDRFYPVTLKRDQVDLANVRVIDLNREPEWKAALRVNGFANQHYRSGWFRLATNRRSACIAGMVRM